jgi:hypothetical protein
MDGITSFNRGHFMKRTSLGLVFSALLVGAPVNAFAADMALKAAPKPVMADNFTGPEIGIALTETTHARQCITSNDPGANGLCDTKDPVGVGFNLGYGFRPWMNNWIVTPFVEADFPNVTVNHNFPGTPFYMGTKSQYDVLGGLKVGPTLTPNLWIYGIGAAGWRGERMTVNFAINSSTSTTVFGGAAGAGIAWEPWAAPVSLSLEFRHEWWNTATYNNPAASPGFNYGFRQQDNVVLAGLNWYFARH